MFQTIAHEVEAEIVEKKSKFIAHIYPVQTEEEVQALLEAIRKKHYDARHHCYAYRIMPPIEGNASILEKMSDDGEPSGTAGAPLLTILRKQALGNCLVVVTRYFGGILLGTGGLVRAYSEACQKAINMAPIVEEQAGKEISIVLPYGSLENLKYVLYKKGIEISHIEYGNEVRLICEVTSEELEIVEEMRRQFQIQEIHVLGGKYIRKRQI